MAFIDLCVQRSILPPTNYSQAFACAPKSGTDMTYIRLLGAIFASAILTACTELPQGAAVDTKILEGAAEEDADFAVYPVTRALLPSVTAWPITGSQQYSWIAHSHGASGQTIAAGDEIDLIVWENGENALLASPGQKAVSLKGVDVSPNGTIFIPYLDQVRVAGLSPDRARARIQEQFETLTPSAQVQLTLTPGRAQAVDLVSGVAKPGSYPLPNRNTSVLNLISMGGGVAAAIKNPQVRLMRGHKIYGTSVARLYNEPHLDTRLQRGDKIIVEEDERYFLSVGASGRENLHNFPKDTVTAMDAVSIMSGLNDTRADAKGVLILREYPTSALASGTRGPRKAQVIFTLDLTSADGLFSAKNFPIYSGDLIYASESKVTQAQTVFGLIGSVFGLTKTASGL
jgi:polysaccharide export outer membrane protein